MTTGLDPTSPRARGFALALVSISLLFAMSGWFAATSVAPLLEARLGLAPGRVTLLTTLVQVGFVVGTLLAALLNLADIIPLRLYFGVSALLAAVCNVGILVVDGFAAAAVLRLGTGLFLAGVYPPAMKMVATWFRSARGFAIGSVVGALTIGKATPYLVKAIGGATVEAVAWSTSLAGVFGAVAVLLLYRDGPYPFARRPFAWSRVGEILRHRPTMLVTGGYLGHMWELYAVWATIQLFLSGVVEASDLAAFTMIALGGVGAVVAGRWADRWGRIRVANGSMWISGACALTIAFTAALPVWIPVGIAMIWGLSVIADSAQFSAVVTEVAPSHVVGTALTLQTMLGFAVSGVTVELTPRIAAAAGWTVAYPLLALGPALGIISMRALARHGGTGT